MCENFFPFRYLCGTRWSLLSAVRRGLRRHSHQDTDRNCFPFFHRGLELPAAKRGPSGFIHLGHDALVDLEILYGSVFFDYSLQNNHLILLFERHRQAPEVKSRFDVGWEKSVFEVNDRRVILRRWFCSRITRLAKLQGPALSRHGQENRVDFSAVQGTVGIQAPSAHRASGDDKSISAKN